jgi:AraC-like DNA-binding protein
MYYSLSRLSIMDVRWADLFHANQKTFKDNHQNPFYELILIAQGPVYLQAANEERLTLQTGESLLLMPWEQHRGWRPDEHQGQFFWVQFSCEPGIQEFVANRAPDLNIVHVQSSALRISQGQIEDPIIIPRRFLTSHRYKLLGIFEELVEILIKPIGHFRFHATLLLGEIIRLLAHDFLEHNQMHTVFPASYTTFRKLANHLNNTYEYEVSTEAMERATDRKYEYLCQVFKKYAGMTIMAYVHQMRIQQAKHFLLNTEKSVREIGESIGYQDPFYFSRMFKRLEGLSPQHYRKLHEHN